jgi:hypothetical protein
MLLLFIVIKSLQRDQFSLGQVSSKQAASLLSDTVKIFNILVYSVKGGSDEVGIKSGVMDYLTTGGTIR